MGDLLFLMFIGIPYILFRLIKDEKDIKRANRARYEQNFDYCNSLTKVEKKTQKNYETIFFLTKNLMQQYPFGGLENAICACVEDGVLVNRSNGQRYVIIKSKQSLDKEKCINMIMQDRVWAMRNFANLDQYLSVSTSKVPYPDIDFEKATLVRNDAIIRYILMKNHWTDDYIKKYMMDSQLHAYISPEYFDEYFERVKDCLDQYPFDYFDVTETV